MRIGHFADKLLPKPLCIDGGEPSVVNLHPEPVEAGPAALVKLQTYNSTLAAKARSATSNTLCVYEAQPPA